MTSAYPSKKSNDNDTSTSPFGVTDADLGRIISTIPAVVNASSLRRTA